MIKTIPQAIDDIAVSLGASPSAEIPTVAQALENVYTALGGDRTDLDTLVLPEVIDLVAPLIQGGGGGGVTFPTFTMSENPADPEGNAVWSTTSTYAEVKAAYNEYGQDLTMPFVHVNNFADETTWNVCYFLDDPSGYNVPEGVTEGFDISGIALFASDGNFYTTK